MRNSRVFKEPLGEEKGWQLQSRLRNIPFPHSRPSSVEFKAVASGVDETDSRVAYGRPHDSFEGQALATGTSLEEVRKSLIIRGR